MPQTPTEAEIAYQQAAAFTDNLIERMLEDSLRATGQPPGAILSGAMMAICRFTVQHLILSPVVPTVRNVFSVVLKAANEASEALIGKPGPIH